MNALASTREAPLAGGDDNFIDPPSPDTFFPDGEGDDYFSINDGIEQLEAHANAKPSVADGWEDRARDVQPGRGYAFEEVVSPADRSTRILGNIAFWNTVSERRYSSYGMPRGWRVGQVVGAARFSRSS